MSGPVGVMVLNVVQCVMTLVWCTKKYEVLLIVTVLHVGSVSCSFVGLCHENLFDYIPRYGS